MKVDQIGRYEIRRELGRGGMAAVYLAYDPHIQRQVAIKVLPRQFTHDPKYLSRFKQEARVIAQLEHPAIVPIYDFGEENDAPYLVMRYMAGGTLKDRMNGKPQFLDEVTPIFNRLGQALDHAHDLGIIHRDLKPSNILFDDQGKAYLADFGIAQIAGKTLSTTGIIGTPAYMSPEQIIGKVKLDGRSDIYTLGTILYQLLAGETPYDADTTGQMYAHVHEPVPTILEVNPGLPPGTQQVIEKAMAKDREARYQSGAELAVAVASLLAPEVTEAKMDEYDKRTENPVDAISIESENAADSESLEAIRPEIMPAENQERFETAIAGDNKNKLAGRLRWLWPVGVLALFAISVYGIWALLSNGNDETLSQQIYPELGDTWVRETDGMTLLYVPEGSFMMGSEDGHINESPVHEVKLDAFWIDQTEVTNKQYKLCVSVGSCASSQFADDDTFNGDGYPVVGVNWYDAQDYCEWAGARLPSEAEWEYAARGSAGNKYPWGNAEPTCELAQFANCGGSSVMTGSLPDGKTWVGGLDMSGNVWEWVHDWYSSTYYTKSPIGNPQGADPSSSERPDIGNYKVLRGGSWRYNDIYLRSTSRYFGLPAFRLDNIGFRCAMSVGE
jgi:serine/threonine-protein kinase